jgi:hypothetical protein
VRLWSQAEVSDDTSSQLPANPVADTFAQLMTGLYSKLQSTAGASKQAWWLAEWFHTHPERGWQPAATTDAHGAWMGSTRSTMKRASGQQAHAPMHPCGYNGDMILEIMDLFAVHVHLLCAGDQVGISPGAAWRAAMQAATEVGSQQLLLGESYAGVLGDSLATERAAAHLGHLC